jgi:hypothetical protein
MVLSLSHTDTETISIYWLVSFSSAASSVQRQRPEMKFRFGQGYEETVFSVLFMQYGDELSIIVVCLVLGFQSC